MDLYEYLIFKKGYTYDEAYETQIRYEVGIDYPKEVRNDIKDWLLFKNKSLMSGKEASH